MWKSANFKEISLKFYELTTLPHTFAHFFSLLDPTMSMKVFSWKSFTVVFGSKRLRQRCLVKKVFGEFPRLLVEAIEDA